MKQHKAVPCRVSVPSCCLLRDCWRLLRPIWLMLATLVQDKATGRGQRQPHQASTSVVFRKAVVCPRIIPQWSYWRYPERQWWLFPLTVKLVVQFRLCNQQNRIKSAQLLEPQNSHYLALLQKNAQTYHWFCWFALTFCSLEKKQGTT